MTANGKNRSDDFVRLAEFVKENWNDFGKWSKEDHYAVFRKGRLKYSLPAPGHPVFKISVIMDDSEWEYLGKFSFAQKHPLLQRLYKKSPEELFSTEKFKDFIFLEFDYKRILNIVKMLSAVSGGRPLGIQIDDINREFIIKPVTPGEYYNHVIKSEQDLRIGIDQLTTSYLLNYKGFRNYVLVKVKDVLQKDELFTKYSEKLGFALTHIFLAEAKTLVQKGKEAQERFGEENSTNRPYSPTLLMAMYAATLALQIAERTTELYYALYWYRLVLPQEVEDGLAVLSHLRPMLETFYPIGYRAIKDNSEVYLVK